MKNKVKLRVEGRGGNKHNLFLLVKTTLVARGFLYVVSSFG